MNIIEPLSSTITSINSVGTGKTYQSAYNQAEQSILLTRRPGDLPSEHEIIVCHLGSRHFRIGLTRDALPRVIPTVIAHRPTAIAEHDSSSKSHLDSNAHMSEEELSERLAQRYKTAKKKPPPNIYTALISHNKTVSPQSIPALNDIYSFEWTRSGGAPWICGKIALRINPLEGYKLFWPIRRGHLNTESYPGYHAVLDDLERILLHAITKELGIKQNDIARYAMVLVIPDQMYAWEILSLTELVLRGMSMKGVTFLQESISSTFGAGVSSALLLDIGAQKTVISAIEDGQILPIHNESVPTDNPGSPSSSLNYGIVLPFGGDDLTHLLFETLKCHSFPYKECDLRRILDFEMMDELKGRILTLNEDDLSSQVYEVYVRDPGHPTKVYPFKVLEERIIVPLALFESGVPLFQSRSVTSDTAMLDDKENSVSYRFVKPEYDQNMIYYTSETGDDIIATLPAIQAVPVEQLTFMDTCKWQGCKATLTSAADCFNHFEEKHAAETTCKWDGCQHATFLDAMAKACHIGNHLQNLIFSHNTTDSPSATAMAAATSAFNAKQAASTAVVTKPQSFLSIEEAILKVLEPFMDASADPNKLKKFLNSVLVVGNGHKLAHFTLFLVQMLRSHFPEHDIDLVLGFGPLSKAAGVTTTSGKENLLLDPAVVGWKGGSVLARLESTQDTWITRRDWDYCDIRAFRGRLSFIPSP